ncbi:hypothetical protein E2C01_034340 [Portunus trituberculatus]|uniref:Uncharacterized protein n=1 Tax=Portunus trituberculatus TaxID=210409 RepID=A0A5B7F2L6_PORTR|nr:hypothetical protein [Portunus trituberculatus]
MAHGGRGRCGCWPGLGFCRLERRWINNSHLLLPFLLLDPALIFRLVVWLDLGFLGSHVLRRWLSLAVLTSVVLLAVRAGYVIITEPTALGGCCCGRIVGPA